MREGTEVESRGLRVYPGTGRVIMGTGIPGFSCTDLKLWGYNASITYNR